MAYVTEDKRVKEIVARVRGKGLDITEAAKRIKAMGFRDWEVNEALGINTLTPR